jgi:ABC-type maltose transport system permease subunit
MELYLILKIIFVIGALVALYAILRNLDIIKIILVYFKDKLFGK